jgi:acyl transferase domain-containing protein
MSRKATTMSNDQRSDTPSDGPQTAAEEQKAVAYLRRALLDLSETRRRLHEVESRLAEPIAIVGMGCRYPGGVQSPEDLWELVAAGRDAVSELPQDRGWDLDPRWTPVPNDPTTSFKGGFIEDVCDFDAEFFGIDDAEARMMDPQQRLLLETAWETCEYAGIDPGALSGSDTGVFVGISLTTYGLWLIGAAPESPMGHYAFGNSPCMISGRLSHVLKFEGPAVTVDTACSSSTVALHLACQSLRQGESSMALAGGAVILATPWLYIEAARGMAPVPADARCRSFADNPENSTVLSEGVGMVLLERLSDAQRLGHEVLAVIRGSAYNQDGASNGLTAPNGLAHERVIRRALRNAGMSPGQVDAVEAHGMGTVLGDPIEAQALIACYGRDRVAGRPLWMGSLKSNLGHTQSAGGVGGVIKMVMAMRHGLLPKTLHVDAPSRFIDWSSGAVSLLLEPVPWVKDDEPRRVAVHSFGMSGTNVHLILEEAAPLELPDPAPERRARLEGSSHTPVPWPISGRGEEGLQAQARRLARFLAERPELDIADIGRSLAARPKLSHRVVLLGTNRAELLEALEGVAEGRTAAGVAEAGVAAVEVAAAEVAEGLQESGSREVLASLAQAWVAGSAVDWEPVFAQLDARGVRLPTYAFARRRHWVEHSPLWTATGPVVQAGRQVDEAPAELRG